MPMEKRSDFPLKKRIVAIHKKSMIGPAGHNSAPGNAIFQLDRDRTAGPAPTVIQIHP